MITIIEYANGYTHDDVHDGDIAYQSENKTVYDFETVEEAIEWAHDWISGEASCGPITVIEAAKSHRLWVSRNETEFRYGVYPPAEEGGIWLGGDWFTDRSWHFQDMTVVERTRIFLAIQPAVYGMTPYWR